MPENNPLPGAALKPRLRRGFSFLLALALAPAAAAASAADFDLSASTSFGAVYAGDNGTLSPITALAVGDLNGDGKADLAVGSPDAFLFNNGVVYVLLSRTELPGENSHLLSYATNYLIRFTGSGNNARAGTSLAIGDVTGDGVNDLIIGAPGTSSGKGFVYIMEGSYLKTLQGTGNAEVLGDSYPVMYRGNAVGSQLGSQVAVGDLVGDGAADLVMTAAGNNAVYVMPSEYIRSFPLGTIGVIDSDTAYFQRFDGDNNGINSLGSALAVADVNGDGFGDLIMGDKNASTQLRASNGALFVVYAETLNALTVNGACDVGATPDQCFSVRYDGALDNDGFGAAAAAGDLDNDGKPDLIASAPPASTAGRAFNGAAYVFLSSLGSAISGGGNLKDLAVPTNYSYRVDGAVDTGNLGQALATGDISGSGRDGLLLGDTGDSLGRSTNGKIYAISGAALPGSGTGASVLVTAVATSTYHGPADGAYISYLLAAGDFSGDGGEDLALVSYISASNEAYIVYGSTPRTSAALAAGAAGVLTMRSVYGTFQLDVPAGAFNAAQSLNLRLPDRIPASFAVAGAAANLTPTGVYIEVVPSSVQDLHKPLRLTMPYRVSDVSGLSASRLVIARYDEARAVWAPYHAEIDEYSRRAAANIDHLSLFGLFQGAASTTGLDGAKVFPNPFLPNRGHTVQRFSNLPASASIRIHTVMGELVRELQADAAGLAEWDGRGRSGQRLASGVYLAYIRGTTGGRSDDRMLKVIIQR